MDVDLPGDCGEWADTPQVHTDHDDMPHAPLNMSTVLR